MRDLSRKVKNVTPAITKCRFKVDSSMLSNNISRIISFMIAAGIDLERLYLLITASSNNTLTLECGSGGSYCIVHMAGEVIHEGYITLSAADIRQLKWGGTDVIFTSSPDDNTVEYRSKIKGAIKCIVNPDPVLRNRPKDIDSVRYTEFDYTAFVNNLNNTYFKAEVIGDDNSDIMVRIDMSNGILTTTVHDAYRAAFSSSPSPGENNKKKCITIPGGVLWQFIKSTKHVRSIAIGISDTLMYFKSENDVFACPSISGNTRDVQKWASSFDDSSASFWFVFDILDLLEGVLEVSSVQGADPDMEKRMTISCKNNMITLSVNGSIGTATREVPIRKGVEGVVDVDFSFIVDVLNIFRKDNRPAKATVWDGVMKVETRGDINSTHIMSVLDRLV